jgi:autotransporter-associated beta strand protein
MEKQNLKTHFAKIQPLLCAGILAFACSPVHSAETVWIGGSSDFNNASRWHLGAVPGVVDYAYIDAGEVQVGNGSTFTPFEIRMGWGHPSLAGTYTQTGGATTVSAYTVVGYLGAPTLNLNGGTFSTGDTAVGWGGTGNGTLNITGGTYTSRAASFIGLDGTATVNVTGGIYNATGNGFGSFRIADYGVGTGIINLSGTGVVNASLYTAVGGSGNGTLNISGGTWNQAAGGIVVGDAADLNWTGLGNVNQSGGTVNSDYVFLQKGTYNLNGGNLSVLGVADTRAQTTGVFNFNGGTLLARDNNTNFIQADTVEIKSGGATINTTDKEVWVTKGMGGAGGLTKSGSGILRLDGANTYAGTTTVTQGTLTVNGSLAGGVNVASGSLLKGSGTIGGASTVNGTLAAGNSPGQMSFSSDLTLASGSNLIWELFGNTSSDTTKFDRISVGGSLLAESGASMTLDFGSTLAGSSVDWSNSFWDADQSWTFLMVAGNTTGFSNLSLANSTFLDAAGNSLATARSGASFVIAQSGNNIMVNYAAVPEPSTGLLLLMGLAFWALIRARRSAQI